MILDCPHCHSKFLIPDAALGNVGRSVRCGRCKHQWFQSRPVPDLVAEAFPVEMPGMRKPQRAAYEESLAEGKASTDFTPANAAELSATRNPNTENTGGDEDFARVMMGVIDHLDGAPHGGQMGEDGVPFYETPIDPSTPYDERLLPAIRPPKGASLWLKSAAMAASFLALLTLLAAYAPQISQRFPAAVPVLGKLGLAPSTGLALSEVSFQLRSEAGTQNYARFVVDCTVRNNSNAPRALPNLRMQLYNRAGERMVEENHLLAPIAIIAPGDDIPCDIPAPALKPGTAETLVLDLGSPIELWQRASLY